MKQEVFMNISISIDDLIESISETVDHDNAPEIIKMLDESYQDFEVTEKTIGKLLDSMRGEFSAAYGNDSEKLVLWDSHVFAIKKMMDEFD